MALKEADIMDHSKLDPQLISALKKIGNQEERVLQVIIGTNYPVGPGEAAILRNFGIDAKEGMKINTAAVSAKDVDGLSNIDWVNCISLQKKLKPI